MSTPENPNNQTLNFGRNDFILLHKDIKRSARPATQVHKTSFYEYVLYTPMQVYVSERSVGTVLLIGEVYSAKTPLASNQEIADTLAHTHSFDELITELHNCTGRYLVFQIEDSKIQFVGDALGQFEVYYSTDFKGIASNLTVLSHFIDLENAEGEQKELYLKIARTTRIQIGTTTAYKDAKHLMPNHYATSVSKEQVRFFPTKASIETKLSLDEATLKIIALMKNFAVAMNHRHALALPLTGGRDSRFLLSIFKDYELKLFVFKHPHVPEDNYDIKTGKLLAAYVEKEYDIIRYKAEIDQKGKACLASFSERPRDNPIPYLINAYPKVKDYMILNGHAGEIGRSFYGKVFRPNSRKLAALLGYPKSSFVAGEMQKWLEDIHDVGDTGANLMDYFYWEQRMGNWGARIRTETANVVESVAPMNSHAVIAGFLTVPRVNRMFYKNDLFDRLIGRIDPGLLQFPLNPSRKNRLILFLIRIRLYWIYRNIRLVIQIYL